MTTSAPTDTTYPLDNRLQAVLVEARESGDSTAEATAQLALDIRGHKDFRDLVQRMTGVKIAPAARGMERTAKTSLIGQPEPGTDLASASSLARRIVSDLKVPNTQRADAAALALVLAEECHRPTPRRQRLRLPVSEDPAT